MSRDVGRTHCICSCARHDTAMYQWVEPINQQSRSVSGCSGGVYRLRNQVHVSTTTAGLDAERHAEERLSSLKVPGISRPALLFLLCNQALFIMYGMTGAIFWITSFGLVKYIYFGGSLVKCMQPDHCNVTWQKLVLLVHT